MIAVAAALLAGAILRLTWGGDIEFKYDEHWLYERAMMAGREAWPSLGMRSSLAVRNPPLSVWLFIALARISGATTPIGLARTVQVLNVVALVLAAWFAWAVVDPREREPWLWGISLGAVNPMAVVFARKIWQQSVLPIFTLSAVVGWWHRDRAWGAFAWGLVGVCMGQIHISGFFLTGGLALWAFVFDRHRTRWIWWLSGCAVGIVPMVPWLLYVPGAFAARSGGSLAVSRLFLPVYFAYWLIEPLGVGLWYSLGAHFRTFLSSGPGNFVGILHVLAILLGAVLFSSVIVRWRRQGAQWRRLFPGENATAFTANAVFLGCGALMTISMLAIHRHYVNVTFPIEFVWLAYLVVGPGVDHAWKRAGRRTLAALCLVELLISASFLRYVHVHGGAPGADYGVAYSAQPPDQTFQP